jgi:hypothetical protein
MAEFIEGSVRALFGSTETDPIQLLVGSRDNREELEAEISELGGVVQEEIGRTTLRVSIPEQSVEELCTLPNVDSVEMDANDVRLQASEDFRHRTNSTM